MGPLENQHAGQQSQHARTIPTWSAEHTHADKVQEQARVSELARQHHRPAQGTGPQLNTCLLVLFHYPTKYEYCYDLLQITRFYNTTDLHKAQVPN